MKLIRKSCGKSLQHRSINYLNFILSVCFHFHLLILILLFLFFEPSYQAKSSQFSIHHLSNCFRFRFTIFWIETILLSLALQISCSSTNWDRWMIVIDAVCSERVFPGILRDANFTTGNVKIVINFKWSLSWLTVVLISDGKPKLFCHRRSSPSEMDILGTSALAFLSRL